MFTCSVSSFNFISIFRKDKIQVYFLVTMSTEKLPLLDSIEPTDSRTQEGMFLRMFAKLIGFFFW